MNFMNSDPESEERAERAWAELDMSALSHNLAVARAACPAQSLLPVIKANGYGHGLEAVASQLMKEMQVSEGVGVGVGGLEGVAVAALSEVRRLRKCGMTLPVVLLPGFVNRDEMEECVRLKVDPVVHSWYQVELLLGAGAGAGGGFSRVWLKGNTGMNRLGMNVTEWRAAREALLTAFPQTEIVAMSHLACADDMESLATPSQVQRFDSLVPEGDSKPRRTLAASGGILAWPTTHFDIVRPGIMMYGSSPLATKSAVELGLRPVMTLFSRIVAINCVEAGDPVGYGESFVADKPMKIGIVSIGYGDGYPRQAPSGTPLLVETPSGMKRVRLAGRVSMDMITIDLTDVTVEVGSVVVLWGQGLPAEEIAGICKTISYELFCQVTPRVPRILSN
jgi:alanine racemase